jgi:DNA invertase Pin-like site-specific DNA recombinase
MTTTAAIYVRISQDKTNEEAGVNRQIKDCKAFAEKEGWTVGEIFTENDTSAYKRKRNKHGVLRVVRPEWSRMLEGLEQQKFGAMIAWDLDRLVRDPRDLEDLIDICQDKKTKVRSTTGSLHLETDDAIAMARIMVAFANKSSADTSKRVKAQKLDKAMSGEFLGGNRRFGYSTNCSELIEEEAAAIRDAYARIIAGSSLTSIVSHWKATGIVGVHGSPVSISNLSVMLRRPLNAGFSTFKGEIVGKSPGPSIVSEATFKKALAIMDRRRNPVRTGRPPMALLTPFLYCKKCEGKMRKMATKGKDKPSGRTYYVCAARCRAVRQDILDDYIGDAFLTWVDDPKIADKVKQPIKFSKSTPAHEIEAAKWRKKIVDLDDLFSSGDLDAVDYAKGTKAAREKVADLEKLTLKAAGKPNLAALLMSKDKEAAWDAMSDADRREILAECVEKITVGPRDKTRNRFHDMSMVEIDWLKL